MALTHCAIVSQPCMLTNGATFKEIADILRHQNIETTAIYAKVNLRSLANATLSWPEVMV